MNREYRKFLTLCDSILFHSFKIDAIIFLCQYVKTYMYCIYVLHSQIYIPIHADVRNKKIGNRRHFFTNLDYFLYFLNPFFQSWSPFIISCNRIFLLVSTVGWEPLLRVFLIAEYRIYTIKKRYNIELNVLTNLFEITLLQ